MIVEVQLACLSIEPHNWDRVSVVDSIKFTVMVLCGTGQIIQLQSVFEPLVIQHLESVDIGLRNGVMAHRLASDVFTHE